LQNTERRYGWLKNALKDFSAEHFCKRWHLPLHLALEFCVITKHQLDQVLQESFNNTDLEVIIRVLHNTQYFEKDLTTKFTIEKDYGKEYELACYQAITENGNIVFNIGSVEEIIAKYKNQAQAKVEAAKLEKESKNPKDDIDDKPYNIPSFLGEISSVFDPFMSTYASIETKKIIDAIEKDKSLLKIEDQELPIFMSTLKLFANIKRALERTLSFSVAQSLYDLYMGFKEVLSSYTKALKEQLK
jgi:vacuolar protein sorting-associated protein 53